MACEVNSSEKALATCLLVKLVNNHMAENQIGVTKEQLWGDLGVNKPCWGQRYSVLTPQQGPDGKIKLALYQARVYAPAVLSIPTGSLPEQFGIKLKKECPENIVLTNELMRTIADEMIIKLQEKEKEKSRKPLNFLEAVMADLRAAQAQADAVPVEAPAEEIKEQNGLELAPLFDEHDEVPQPLAAAMEAQDKWVQRARSNSQEVVSLKALLEQHEETEIGLNAQVTDLQAQVAQLTEQNAELAKRQKGTEKALSRARKERDDLKAKLA